MSPNHVPGFLNQSSLLSRAFKRLWFSVTLSDHHHSAARRPLLFKYRKEGPLCKAKIACQQSIISHPPSVGHLYNSAVTSQLCYLCRCSPKHPSITPVNTLFHLDICPALHLWNPKQGTICTLHTYHSWWQSLHLPCGDGPKSACDPCFSGPLSGLLVLVLDLWEADAKMRLDVQEIYWGKRLQGKELGEVGKAFGRQCGCGPCEGEREGRRRGWQEPQTCPAVPKRFS